jgi:hypothetical protein
MHFSHAPPRDPEPNQSPPNLDIQQQHDLFTSFVYDLFLFVSSNPSQNPLQQQQPLISLSLSLSPQFVAYPDSSLLFFLDCNSSSHARARARGCFPTLCVLRSLVPRPTLCEKGKTLSLCGKDTRVNWCENKTRLNLYEKVESITCI